MRNLLQTVPSVSGIFSIRTKLALNPKKAINIYVYLPIKNTTGRL